jgi:predicted dienelactone hydrolase
MQISVCGSLAFANGCFREYLAQKLASRGYIVASINANRGITGADDGLDTSDSNLILARGRLVLKHLQKLSEWTVNGGAPSGIGDLTGKIDFANVGLMGHSHCFIVVT